MNDTCRFDPVTSEFVPPACSLIAIEDDLYQRLRIYITHNEIDEPLLMRRLLNDALREFLDDHAPIQYPVSPLEG